jgi:hypothetical protein
MAGAPHGRTFGGMNSTDDSLTIRVAQPRDDVTLRRLAALDSARPLSGRVLLAETTFRPVAAISLTTGAVTADPFQYSEGAVRVLRLRRYQRMRQGGDVAPARSLLRRFASGAA